MEIVVRGIGIILYEVMHSILHIARSRPYLTPVWFSTRGGDKVAGDRRTTLIRSAFFIAWASANSD